jgi:hypothetical protein
MALRWDLQIKKIRGGNEKRLGKVNGRKRSCWVCERGEEVRCFEVGSLEVTDYGRNVNHTRAYKRRRTGRR